MDKIEFKNIFEKNIKEFEIRINDDQIDKFYEYMNLLLEWNQKMNLTAITDCREIIIKHFVDSLTIEKYIEKDSYLVDVGTGAGFPGIPLKILREDLNVVLLDSLNKRIKFLNEVCDKLKLNKIEAVHARAEEFARNKNYREKFDVVTSRAVANLSTLSEYMLPLVKKEGICICMKGKEVKEELHSAQKAIKVLGGTLKNEEELYLDNNQISRNIIVLEKVERTPAKYPRKAGMPSKEPLK